MVSGLDRIRDLPQAIRITRELVPYNLLQSIAPLHPVARLIRRAEVRQLHLYARRIPKASCIGADRVNWQVVERLTEGDHLRFRFACHTATEAEVEVERKNQLIALPGRVARLLVRLPQLTQQVQRGRC